MSRKLQPFPALDADTYEALKASIKRFGIVVPIVVDKSGRTIDGHHREAIARELRIPCPQVVRAVGKDDDAIALAYSLNADRRQLTADQRREIVEDLRAQGYSLRAIAGVTKTSKSTVERDLDRSGVPCGTPDTPTPTEGKGVDDSASDGSEASVETTPATGPSETPIPLASSPHAKGDRPESEPDPASEEASGGASAPPASRVTGRDGKSYPRRQPRRPKREPTEEEQAAAAALNKIAGEHPEWSVQDAFAKAEKAAARIVDLDPEALIAATEQADLDALHGFAKSLFDWSGQVLSLLDTPLRRVK